MKIAIIHENYPFGGKEEVTRNLSAYLADKDVRVFIYSCSYSEFDKTDDRITYEQFPEIRLQSSENADFIIRELIDNRIDILLVPDYDLPWLKRVKDETKCKIVFTLHSVPFWEVVLKYQLAKRRSEKSILSFIEWHTLQRFRYDILKLHKKKIEKKYRELCLLVDKYVTLTDQYAQMVQHKVSIKNTDLFLSISNPIALHNDVDLTEKKKEVIYVGRLSYSDKRVDRLLDIWKKLCSDNPGWSLKIVGDGPELSNLERKVTEEQIENVSFEGFHSDVTIYYERASIICMTSGFEGWPLVLGEAQSYGVVPIAFNCSAGVEDILSPDGINGILVPAFDMELYVKELGRLMSDDEARLKIAKAALLKSKGYSLEVVGQKWLDLFSSLIQK